MAKRRLDDFEDSDEFRELQQTLGRRLRRLRMARNMTQRQLAELAEFSNTNYAVLEAGAGNATLLVLARVAKALAVPISSLFEDTAGATTTGAEGVIVRLLVELERVGRHLEERRDELSKINDEMQGFVDANRDALNALAAEGKLSPAARR
jgi:HTH-type transcriptional regulator, competence development regulator